jgi:histone H3/H4
MAMFFANLSWNEFFDTFKLPEFPLSIKEKERIAKRIAQANRPKRIRKSICELLHTTSQLLFVNVLHRAC